MQIIRLPVLSRNGMLDALTAQIDAANLPGSISFFSGSIGAPESRLLANLRFSSPSFREASQGAADAYELEPGMATGAGRIGWARIADGNGNAVFDCSVGTEDAVIILNILDTVIGGPVILKAFRLRMPAE